ncbi:golgin subfamily A member 6-like protein 22 isoform X2 [Simochromis diagramma]|uniref:golgin subfamily A member 6-like protein 22 isoform X2 n=1 Tax=Simochromis diagramma TaxID=43689 RepID=UPI001A7EC2EC|nr:golgin subfamily A member 6-like protein 22 isoform X2 [Simochromis diagramma]
MSKQKNSRHCNQAAAPQELSFAEMGKKLHDANIVVKQEVEELNLVIQSLAEMEKKLHQANMVVNHQKEELNSVIESFAEMGKKLHDANIVVKQEVEELNLVIQSLGEMEEVYKVNLKQPGLAEMEKFYKQKIQEERSARKETEEEFKSFKDRMAGEVDLKLKTGDSENMNNPVNETRLKEMYEKLRNDWAKIKPKIKQAAQSDPEPIKVGIQRNFQSGAKGIEQKKKEIESVFKLNADSTEASQKVHEYTKLTLQNLQLAVYYSFKDTAAQGFHGQEGETHSFSNLTQKCRWLSALLVLNDPPLQPDWKNHDPGQDAWNFFPQKITAESATSLCQDHSENVVGYSLTFQHPDVNQSEDKMMM